MVVPRSMNLTKAAKKAQGTLVNSQTIISMQKSSNCLMSMVLARLPKKTFLQLPNLWAGVNSKVSLFTILTLFLVEELILDLDPNHDGEITEEEFTLIFKYISQRN